MNVLVLFIVPVIAISNVLVVVSSVIHVSLLITFHEPQAINSCYLPRISATNDTIIHKLNKNKKNVYSGESTAIAFFSISIS